MISALEALNRLIEGNRRFVSKTPSPDAVKNRQGEWEPIADQKPFAVILGCSDSRVPVEMVFDQGFGDLFVIRVAGNVVAPSQIGSVEFAAERFGTRLIVVLGHTSCGAIKATLEHLRGEGNRSSKNLRAIVDRIQPSVESLLATDLVNNNEALEREAGRSHVRVSADHLRSGSRIIEELIKNDGLSVVGAEYCLETGIVDFFDGVNDLE